MKDLFTPVWDSFFNSTIALEEPHVRLVLIGLIRLADGEGVVRRSVGSLAVFMHMTPEQTQDAINILGQPDPFSSSADHEGRRILEVEEENGWVLVNYDKYQSRLNSAKRRVYKTLKQREYRESESTVDNVDKSGHIEERRGEEIRVDKKKKTTLSVSRTKRTVYPPDFEEFWAIYPRPVSKKKALEAWIKTKPDRPANSDLLHALRNRISGWRNQGTEPDKIPHPATWLNGHRWTDEPMRGDL